MKKFKKNLLIIILIIIVSTITFFIGKQIGLNTDISNTSTTVEEKTVEKRTITKTITGNGEISSVKTEQLSLDTSKYYETMCVEEDDTVKAGENILRYTDGTYLTAPYDLVILSYLVPETGKIIEEDDYVEVQDLDNLITVLAVNESEIANISKDQEVEIILSADTSKIYKGVISKIDSIGSYSSSGTTFPVTISFVNDGNAKIGMSVSCTINIAELENVLTIPINAIQISNNKKYVLLVENEKTIETEIETGLSDDEYVEVKSGLREGQIVQVITTTTQNIVRSSNDKSSNMNNRGFEMNGESTSGGEMKSFNKSYMPSDMSEGGTSFDKNQ